MQNKLLAALFSLLVFPSLCLAKGGDVGTGGDSVQCRKESGSSFEGYYSLDYLLNLGKPGQLAEVTSWEESSRRILTGLRRVSPYLAARFAEFLTYSENYTDYTAPRLWEASPYGLVDIRDQKIIRKLPSNCYVRKEEGAINVIQSVIRQKKPTIILYAFDPEIFRALKTRPLQLSLLMVHEWLWDLTSDIEALRRLSFYLHSPALDSADKESFHHVLEGMGIGNGPEVGFCDRSPGVRRALEQASHKSCQAMTKDNLQIEYFDVKGQGLDAIQDGDFAYLGGVRGVALSSNRLETLPEWAFRPLSSVKEIYLDSNQLSGLYERTFWNLPQLRSLTLSRNHFREFPPTLFEPGRSCPAFIDLSDNEITKISGRLFSTASWCPTLLGPHGKVVIHLERNQIRSVDMAAFEPLGSVDTVVDLRENPLPLVEKDAIRSWLRGHQCLHSKPCRISVIF